MPLYQFVCEDCGAKKEVLQAFGDPSPTCLSCSSDMTRKICGTNFSLKGDGWARDNYGLKKKKKK
jgi:putative FmdB family regulatory protein